MNSLIRSSIAISIALPDTDKVSRFAIGSMPEWLARNLSLISLAFAALLTGCSGLANHESPLSAQNISFDSCEAGKPPPGFTTALTGGGGPCYWVVREDPSSKRRVLVQESSDDTSYRFPLCIYDKVVARDVAVEVKFKPISGKVDQAGGIVLRYNPESYYIARANALEDNVNLFKTVRGKRSKIEEVPIRVTTGQWHTLRFEAQGRRLKVTFDGMTVIDTNDKSFSQPGMVGLWTKADSVSAFADFKIEPPGQNSLNRISRTEPLNRPTRPEPYSRKDGRRPGEGFVGSE